MIKKFSFSLIVALVAISLIISSVSAVSYGTQLRSGNSPMYSRAIKLANGNVLATFVIGYGTNQGAIEVYQSTNNGASFSFLTEYIDTAETGYDIGAEDILEVTPGTILMAYNVWDDNTYQSSGSGQKLKIVRSTNGGASWTVISSPEPDFSQWEWEPRLAIASDGSLQLYYSWAPTIKGNNMSMFDQVIARRQSTDGGVTWTSRVTAAGSSSANLGMPVITKLGSTYYMAVENYDDNAADHIYTSTDGKTWTGGTNSLQTSSGWMFSTPMITNVNGALYALGKIYYKKSGCFYPVYCPKHANNGKVILKSTNGGSTWTEVTAPFQWKSNDDYGNWSPGLLPLSSTQMFLITSSDYFTPRSEVYGTGTP